MKYPTALYTNVWSSPCELWINSTSFKQKWHIWIRFLSDSRVACTVRYYYETYLNKICFHLKRQATHNIRWLNKICCDFHTLLSTKTHANHQLWNIKLCQHWFCNKTQVKKWNACIIKLSCRKRVFTSSEMKLPKKNMNEKPTPMRNMKNHRAKWKAW